MVLDYPTSVSVSRGGRDVKPPEDETSLSVQAALFNSLIPLRSSMESATSFFGKNKRAGYYIQYNNGESDIEEALKQWKRSVDNMIANNEYHYDSSPRWMYHGQPIRLTAEFNGSINMHFALYQFFEEVFHESMHEQRSQLNVICSVKAQNPKAVIYPKAPSSALLNEALNNLNATVRSEVFEPRNAREKQILFSFAGRKVMEQLSSIKPAVIDKGQAAKASLEFCCYLHWNNKSRVLRLYGVSVRSVLEMKAKLITEIEAIAKSQEDYRLLFNPAKRGALLRAWKALPDTDERKLFLLNFNVLKSYIDITGQRVGIELCEDWLRREGYLASQVAAMTESLAGQCSLCFCDIEAPAYFYSACGHGGCSSCLSNMFSQAELKQEITLPAVCFDCKCDLTLNDVSALASGSALSALKEAAVNKYVRENPTILRMCPAPGCNQILSASMIRRPTSLEDEIRQGGTLVFCDNCSKEYCLVCSDRDHKPSIRHKDSACADRSPGGEDELLPYILHIAEQILTNRCPSCRTAFLDFDGCCAVTCSTCNNHFCGFCLSAQRNSSIAHEHVRQCALNKNKGYFASATELDVVYKEQRIRSLRQYFSSSVPKGYLKRRLVVKVRKTLADVGIDIDQIF